MSRKKVEELAETLQVNGISALPYHAGMESAVRSENQDAFLMEKVDVIVATIAFGMGIDKPDIRSIGIRVLILKALRHTLPDLNKHREVYERRLVSRVDRDFSVITERI